jgi:sarcosine oxidase
MSAERFDVAVVGGGVMGCATAMACARAGLSTVLFEQFYPANARGSSHGPSRIIRLAYHDPIYTELARDAFAAWRHLERRSGERLMQRTGGVDFADDPDNTELQQRAEAMTAANVPFERLDAGGLRGRFPQFHPHPQTAALYQGDTAVLAADRCVQTLAVEARRAGALLLNGERVTALRADGAGVAIESRQRDVLADRAVVAAGGWAPGLLGALGLRLPLRVTREQVAAFAPLRQADFAPRRFPIFIHHRGDQPLVSGFPCYGVRGVKLMFDVEGPEVSADDPDRAVNLGRVHDLSEYAARLLPGLSRRVVAATCCLYTYTPDGDFIVDRHPEHPQIVVLAACSGHGFKFGPLLGAMARDLAFGGPSHRAHERFSITRAALRAAATQPSPEHVHS